MTIHESVVAAVHAQPWGAVTEIEPEPPPLSWVNAAGAIDVVQVGPVGDLVPQPSAPIAIAVPSAIAAPPKSPLVMLHLTSS
jgi:hypothetical protein